jgi:hypothetical protein
MDRELTDPRFVLADRLPAQLEWKSCFVTKSRDLQYNEQAWNAENPIYPSRSRKACFLERLELALSGR